ncbi:hypothetical protein M9H77_32567 [Catharanthus roseus]|uniref:Uncharacterized protein n=1 Tax=Catharanthus roseus TaxID=4058 RepID=A0ACC0A4S1_CATRO|nr:hypothetical protein M9H77_32567 [Catharanthus roseus]
MGLTRSLFFLFLSFFSLVFGFDHNLGESLDAILHDHAFKTLYQGRRPQTGALYNASLPPSLAGMKVSVVRLRSRTLWRLGANFSHFHIPPETLPVPYVKRLLIVYHDLGNWSSYYYNTSGYTLLTSVIGFAIYDASDSRGKDLMKLNLDTMVNPIVIAFQNSTSDNGSKRRGGRAKCATFGDDGRVILSEMNMPGICYSTNQGHFSIISPFKNKKQTKMWWFWVIGFLLGVVGLSMVAFIGTVVFKARSVKKTHDMEREADEGEVLRTFWVDSSKMPRAEVTRTYPVLESAGPP